jgi:hypothetical protein
MSSLRTKLRTKLLEMKCPTILSVSQEESSKLEAAVEELQEQKRTVESLKRQQREEHLRQCKEISKQR